MTVEHKEILVPVLYGHRSEKRFREGFPDHVWLPDYLQKRAQINHSQTLERLAERGGLALDEIVALIENRKWRPMNIFELVDAFRKYELVGI